MAVRIPEGFLSRGQVADIFGVGVTTVRSWQNRGKLETIVYRDWNLSSVGAVKRWIKSKGNMCIPSLTVKEAFRLFELGSTPMDIILELEDLPLRRARLLWHLWQSDDSTSEPSDKGRPKGKAFAEAWHALENPSVRPKKKSPPSPALAKARMNKDQAEWEASYHRKKEASNERIRQFRRASTMTAGRKRGKAT